MKFDIELNKVVDDFYDVEIRHHLINKLIGDLKNGLVNRINKFAVITE